jgi:hypothetical protein
MNSRDATNGPEIADSWAAANASAEQTDLALLPAPASPSENSSVAVLQQSGIEIDNFHEGARTGPPLTGEQQARNPGATEMIAVQPAVLKQRQDEPARRHSLSDRAEEVQQRLMRFGYLAAAAPGPWGPRSREALRAFKVAHQLGADDVWDEGTERVLFSPGVKPADSFVGIWAASPSACSQQLGGGRTLRAFIDHRGARAGDTYCAFANKQPSGDTWTFVATCENPRERWTARVRLQTTGNKMSWSSQRGTQVYSRCEDRVLTAQASL